MARRRRSKGSGPRSREARANVHAGAPTGVARLSEDELCARLAEAAAAGELEDVLLLVLDGVQDPHNLGACLRSADGAGVGAVVVPRHKASPVTETVVRIACGGAEHVPVVSVANLARFLAHVRAEYGLRAVGAADEADAELYEGDLTGPLALVLGAEGEGMRRLTRENCDALLRIPMRGEVDCLNVSNASAVCLWEAIRQRHFR